MKKVEKNKNNESGYSSIRVKNSTKDVTLNFLKSINSSGENGKVTFDILVNFLIKNVTEDDIQKLQLESLTWDIEGQRIRNIYEKKVGKFKDKMWIQFIQTDQYREFASLHSRLPLPWEQPTEMFHQEKKKKPLTKRINNDTLNKESA